MSKESKEQPQASGENAEHQRPALALRRGSRRNPSICPVGANSPLTVKPAILPLTQKHHIALLSPECNPGCRQPLQGKAAAWPGSAPRPPIYPSQWGIRAQAPWVPYNANTGQESTETIWNQQEGSGQRPSSHMTLAVPVGL